MAKRNNIIGIIAICGGVLAATYFAVSKRLKKLSVSFDSFGQNIKFENPYLYVPLSFIIKNPEKQAINFKSFEGYVYINGEPVGKLTYKTPVVLKPMQNTTIRNFVIKTQVVEAITKALDIIDQKVSITIQGTILADNMSFPVNEKLNIK